MQLKTLKLKTCEKVLGMQWDLCHCYSHFLLCCFLSSPLRPFHANALPIYFLSLTPIHRTFQLKSCKYTDRGTTYDLIFFQQASLHVCTRSGFILCCISRNNSRANSEKIVRILLWIILRPKTHGYTRNTSCNAHGERKNKYEMKICTSKYRKVFAKSRVEYVIYWMTKILKLP